MDLDEPTDALGPVDNAPYLTYRHAGLTIEGYSRAAREYPPLPPIPPPRLDLGGLPPPGSTIIWARPRAQARLRSRRPPRAFQGHAALALSPPPPRSRRGFPGLPPPPGNNEKATA